MKNLRYVNSIGGISGEYPDDSEHAGITLYICTSGELYDRCIAGEFGVISPYVPEPEVINIPQSVTRFQAFAAMHNAGILTQAQSIVNDPATDMLVKLAWDNAQDFERTSPSLITLAGQLGLTDTDLDQLFISASTIKA